MSNQAYALNYLRNGLSVFPTKGKKPLVSWEEYQNQKTTEEQVIEWWTKWPEADIGIVTGAISGIVVVDIDGGEVPQLPPTTVSQTSLEHYQYFFKHPGFLVQNSVKIIAPNIDIRGDGGFVIVPPSRHFDKITGGKDFTYTWLIPPKEAGFADLPEWIIDKLKTKPAGNKFDINSLKGVIEGQRNATAASIAGKLLQSATEEDLPVIWELLKTWNTKNKPQMEESELISVFDSIWSKEKNNLNKTQPISTPLTEINRVFEPILAKNMKTQSSIAINWVAEGFLAKNYLTLLAAREKMGKTSLLKLLIKCLTLGEDFLGLPITKSRILVISEENAGHWNRRLDDLGLNDCDSVWFVTQPFNTRLKQKAWEEYITQDVTKFCELYKIEVLILDTISPIWPVLNENDASEVQTALLPLVAITKQGVAVLALHHYSKAGDIRGSTVLGAVPDILLALSKPQGDEDTTKRLLKCRSRFEESPPHLLLDYKDGEYILLGTPQNVAKQEKLDQVKKELEKYPSGVTVQELLDSWNTESKKPSRSMLKIYLNDLCFTQGAYQLGEKDIKGGRAFIYSLYPNNGDNKLGFAKITKIEANDLVNHDTGTISNQGSANIIVPTSQEDDGSWLEA